MTTFVRILAAIGVSTIIASLLVLALVAFIMATGLLGANAPLTVVVAVSIMIIGLCYYLELLVDLGVSIYKAMR